ncbi:lipopolysaccharide biosynthesis protein [Micromonospora sp. NPDC050417]|uniref:lipopolysaccharide biosynthesis protein n=1 Tax=Micromonospora sp. NPDC050417 TaxID=3364280 RepID=UPI00378AC07E
MASATTVAGRKVAHNTLSMVAARVVMAVTGLATLPLVYERLGSRGFGIWVLLSSVFAILALADLGLGSAMVREVAATHAGEPRKRLSAVLGLGLGWAVCVGVLATAAIPACWPWLSRLFHLAEMADEARRAALWLALGLFFGGVELPWRAVLEGTQRYGTVAWISAATALLGAALTVLMVRFGGGLAALAAVTTVASGIRTLLVVAAARRHHSAYRPRISHLRRTDLQVVRGYGLRVQATSAAGAVNTELDRLVLGTCFGPATAGNFDLGTRLLNLLRLPPGFVLIALFPVAVTGAARGGAAWLDTFYLRTTRYVTAFVAPGAAVIVVCADPLVRLWLGHQVEWAAANLALLAPAYALNLAAGAATIVTRAEGRPGRETRYVLLSVVLNLALTAPMLILLGPLGVPAATALAVVISTLYFFWYFHQRTNRPIRPVLRSNWWPVVASTVAGSVGAAAAPYLPDGPDRAGAALAVTCRVGCTLLVVGVLLAAARLVRPPGRRRPRLPSSRAGTRMATVVGRGGDR